MRSQLSKFLKHVRSVECKSDGMQVGLQGQKRMPVACKVPAVKRSMERFVFCVKALLHGASHGNSFWMGNGSVSQTPIHFREVPK